jgi:iron donor protein CyaY
MALDEGDFQKKAEATIAELDAAFSRAGIECDLESGVLKVSFEEPEEAVFVISPNGPARQVWVSARLQSFKFDWREERSEFELHGSNESLRTVLERLTREQSGDEKLRL